MFATAVAKTFATSLCGEAALRQGPKNLLSCVVSSALTFNKPSGQKTLPQEHVDRRGRDQTEISHNLLLPHEILAAAFDCNAMDRFVGRDDATCLR